MYPNSETPVDLGGIVYPNLETPVDFRSFLLLPRESTGDEVRRSLGSGQTTDPRLPNPTRLEYRYQL